MVNLSNAYSACDGRSAAVVQSAHALAFVPVMDAASGRQMLMQITLSAEGCGNELGPQLKYDLAALRQLAEHASDSDNGKSADVEAGKAGTTHDDADGHSKEARPRRLRRNGFSNGHHDAVCNCQGHQKHLQLIVGAQ